jgi:uncharacterized protein YyaL (SSP411 family)
MLSATLDHIARGGIHDQLAGGFHRYATDRGWKIPHFEKMLYDNGHLIDLYAREWARTGDPQAARVVRQTSEFLAAEMTSPEGAFWSAIDAETGGREGAYYVWTRNDLKEVLCEEDFGFLAPLFGFSGAPFFEEDSYVPHLPERLESQAERRRMATQDLLGQVDSMRQALLEARSQRQRPLTDDKILADWNGMAIAGLAAAGRLLKEPVMLRQAVAAADFVLGSMRLEGGLLLHSWRQGKGSIEAFLADYAFFVRGLLALFEADGQVRWLDLSIELTEQQIERLADPLGGFFGSTERTDVLFRSKEVFDGATPAANAVAVLNLQKLAKFTGEARWSELADKSLGAFGDTLSASPDGARMLLIAALRSQRAARMGDRGQLVLASIHIEDENSAGWQPFALRVEVSDGWHIYAAGQSEAGTYPTELIGEGIELRNLLYPAGRVFSSEIATATPLSVSIYEGSFEISGEMRSAPDAEAAVWLAYQPCTDTRCLQSTRLQVRLR